MKLHIQALYRAFYLRPLTSPNMHRSLRELCIESMIDLTKHQWIFREFYINYDCDVQCTNLLQETVEALSQTVIPGTSKLKRFNLLALRCLRSFLSSFSPYEDVAFKPDENAAHSLRVAADTKNRIKSVVDEFNKKPKRGIHHAQELGILVENDNENFVPQVVEFLHSSPEIEQGNIGIFLGGSKDESEEHVLKRIRSEYTATRYDFSRQKFEDALRMFLEDFVLPLETQQIDRILECFALTYCAQNPNWAGTVDRTHILVFSMMMVHTSLYNEHAKRDKLDFKTFKSMNRELLQDDKIPVEVLAGCYHSLVAQEITKNDGKNKEMTKAAWEFLQKRSREEWALNYTALKSETFHLLELDQEILDMIWDPSIAALSHVFSHVQSQDSIDNVISGFRFLCIIIFNQSRYYVSEKESRYEPKMDAIVKRLCELSDLLDVTMDNSAFLGASPSKQEALTLAFQVAHRYGDCLGEIGWDNLLRCLLRAAFLQILPAKMCQLDDFAGGGKRKSRSLLAATVPDTPTAYSSIFSLSSWLSVDDTALEDGVQEEYFVNKAKKVMEEVNLSLLRNSKELGDEALIAFVNSIIKHASFGVLNFDLAQPDPDPETGISYIRQSCFLVQMLSGVALNNWKRSDVILPIVKGFLRRLVTFKAQPEIFTDHHVVPMNESGAVAVMKLCVRVLFLEYHECTDRLLEAVELLSLMTIPHYLAVDSQVIAAILHLVTRLRQVEQKEEWCAAMRWHVIFDTISKISEWPRCFPTIMKIVDVVAGKELILVYRWESMKSFMNALNICFQREHCKDADRLFILKIHARIANQLASTEDWSQSDLDSWEKRSFLMGCIKDYCLVSDPKLRLEALTILRLVVIHPDIQSHRFVDRIQKDIKMVTEVLYGLLQLKDPHITNSRIKIANLLCKLFAQSLPTILKLPNFHTICVDVFNAIEQLYLMKDDPKYATLSESIREFVINMINVMNSSEVFSKEVNPVFAEELWNLTKTYGEHIIPDFVEKFEAPNAPLNTEEIPTQNEEREVVSAKVQKTEEAPPPAVADETQASAQSAAGPAPAPAQADEVGRRCEGPAALRRSPAEADVPEEASAARDAPAEAPQEQKEINGKRNVVNETVLSASPDESMI